MENVEVSNQRVFGAVMLISGSCIGAGMLGLPVLTAIGGFVPTCFFFTLSWLFMTITGLLLLEVNLWFKEEVSFITMLGKTLGKGGQFIGSFLFAYLFYSLMVVYVLGSGQLIADVLPIGEWEGGLLLSLLFALFLYFGTGAVDKLNRILMLGLILSYLIFMGGGFFYVNFDLLSHKDWTAATLSIPAMIISFGYHNLIPSMTTYLNHNVKKLRLAIILGSLIPLIIYLLWEWLILGLVPVDGENGFRQALQEGEMVTRALKLKIGSSWIVSMIEYFAFFAIVTSFLGVALSFIDFLADGLRIKKTASGKLILLLLSLAPPLLFAYSNPKIFLNALTFAGAYGAVTLFGIIPALMVWSGRYFKKMEGKKIVAGGKGLLVLIILLSLVIIGIGT